MNTLVIVVVASYLTLSLLSPDHARELWAPYAVIAFCLAVTNLVLERRR